MEPITMVALGLGALSSLLGSSEARKNRKLAKEMYDQQKPLIEQQIKNAMDIDPAFREAINIFLERAGMTQRLDTFALPDEPSFDEKKALMLQYYQFAKPPGTEGHNEMAVLFATPGLNENAYKTKWNVQKWWDNWGGKKWWEEKERISHEGITRHPHTGAAADARRRRQANLEARGFLFEEQEEDVNTLQRKVQKQMSRARADAEKGFRNQGMSPEQARQAVNHQYGPLEAEMQTAIVERARAGARKEKLARLKDAMDAINQAKAGGPNAAAALRDMARSAEARGTTDLAPLADMVSNIVYSREVRRNQQDAARQRGLSGTNNGYTPLTNVSLGQSYSPYVQHA